MSLIDQFFEEYDNLMVEWGGVETFWRGITDKKSVSISERQDVTNRCHLRPS